MRTRDPFLITFGIWADRLMVWFLLCMFSFVVLWWFVWDHCLGQGVIFALTQLRDVITGEAKPVVKVLFALSFAVAIETTSLLSAWLFARWRRHAELRTGYVRGSRLEG